MHSEEMENAEELFELRDHLLNLAGKISEKYTAHSKVRVVNLLLRHVCERCIIEAVSYTHLTLPTTPYV